MFTSIDSFLTMWKFEADATARTIAACSDAALKKKVSGKDRTLGRIAWHLTQTIPEMTALTGLKVKGPKHDAAPPAKKAAIVKAYRAAANSLAAEVKKRWTNATLKKTDNMYGETWARGFTLACLILHQTHHRGQMTVLMRQAGVKVPGVYGPAREDWAGMGMKPPKI